jgi:glycosyltransferase involved in cell wall biosynthesis
VRILVDYRPALRARTGVGEYIHQVIRALARTGADEITAFSSSWKDRPAPSMASELPGVQVVDRRIPVRVLNLAWHRLGWPPVESIVGGEYEVAHSPDPLLLPSRSAAQVVTIHDLDFLAHPERTTREIRRDYPALARAHAHRADRIIVSSQYAAGEVVRLLQVPRDRIAVCPAGAPEWVTEPRPAAVLANGYILFMGTLEARKNIGGLLEAYGRLVLRIPSFPKLVLAGAASPDAAGWLADIRRPPLAGHVEHLGYVPDDQRRGVYERARMLVLPSFEEGFGLPALEAMASGVPVVASNRGALPEVVGDAGALVDPTDIDGLAAGIERLVTDRSWASATAARGLSRASQFTWAHTARAVRQAYEDAVAARHDRQLHPSHAHRH